MGHAQSFEPKLIYLGLVWFFRADLNWPVSNHQDQSAMPGTPKDKVTMQTRGSGQYTLILAKRPRSDLNLFTDADIYICLAERQKDVTNHYI